MAIESRVEQVIKKMTEEGKVVVLSKEASREINTRIGDAMYQARIKYDQAVASGAISYTKADGPDY